MPESVKNKLNGENSAEGAVKVELRDAVQLIADTVVELKQEVIELHTLLTAQSRPLLILGNATKLHQRIEQLTGEKLEQGPAPSVPVN